MEADSLINSDSHQDQHISSESTNVTPNSGRIATYLHDLRRKCNWAVFVLFLVFGLGSWVAINGIYAELPIFVLHLPESWAIASILSLGLQLANIFPIAYFIYLQQFKPKRNQDGVIFGVIVFGILVCILLAFLWDFTGRIGGKESSISLIVLTFFAGVVDCMTSIVFLPFVAQYKSIHATALAVGEASTGLVAGIFAIIQNPGENPNFPPSVYFGLMGVVMLCSGIAFSFLKFHRVGKQDKTEEIQKETNDSEDNYSSLQVMKEISKILLLTFWLSFWQNGVLVSISTYATLPYPNGPQVLKWSVILGMIAPPISSLLTTFFQSYRLILLTALYSITSILILVIAAMSPNPPLVSHRFAGALVVMLFTVNTSIISYTKTMIYLTLQRDISKVSVKKGMKAFRQVGLITQIGAAIGSFLMFVLINYAKVFVEKKS